MAVFLEEDVRGGTSKIECFSMVPVAITASQAVEKSYVSNDMISISQSSVDEYNRPNIFIMES